MQQSPSLRPIVALAALAPILAGCASNIALSDHDCMTRVMYFESNRSSSEGMLAVGTTVMNRLDSPKYPKTVCEVVGQRNQFAPGVLERPLNPREVALSAKMADKVLGGDRHPQIGPDVMFFHTAGMTFPYTNMHYVLIAGGNAFYDKRPGGGGIDPMGGAGAGQVAVASYTPRPTRIASARPPHPAVAPDADGGIHFGSADPQPAEIASSEEPAEQE